MKNNQKIMIIMVDGGFCSQIVKYALGEFLKKHHQVEIKYDISWYEKNGKDCDGKYSRQFMLTKVFPNIDFKIASDKEIAYYKNNKKFYFCNKYPYKFCRELLAKKAPLYVDGYYENIKYFNDVKDILIKNLDFSKIPLNTANRKVLSEIKASSLSCAVHIRRGDFVNAGLAFLTREYYLSAIEKIKEFYGKLPNLFLFSNDLDYVKREIVPYLGNFKYTIVDANSNDTGYLDLFLIMSCNAQVCSNSSFGFWGAFLNSHSNKMAVLPSEWLPVENDLTQDSNRAHFLEGCFYLDRNGKIPEMELSKNLQKSIQRVYDNMPNYLIEYSKKKNVGSAICAIYFSSNGIFYPKDLTTFQNEIEGKNRFEWYKTRLNNAEKHIFIRDINMFWYQKGISSKLDSIDKVSEFLKKETKGYDVVCIGSSAGAYAAILFASLLGAKYCYASSPCLNVKDCILDNRRYYMLSEYNALKYEFYLKNFKNFKYCDISSLVKKNKVPIFWVFPMYSEVDKEEIKKTQRFDNIKILKYVTSEHGQPFSNALVKLLLNLPFHKLSKIFNNKQYFSEIEIVKNFGFVGIYKYCYLSTANVRKRWYFLVQIKFWRKLFKIFNS